MKLPMNPLSRSDLDQFTGSETFYRHALFQKIVYTEGVQYLAENGHAYWLIEAIASHLLSQEFNAAAKKDPRLKLIHFWKLAVHPNKTADLTARADSDEEPFITQHLSYTDFPLESIDIWAADHGQGFTLMLPSEY